MYQLYLLVIKYSYFNRDVVLIYMLYIILLYSAEIFIHGGFIPVKNHIVAHKNNTFAPHKISHNTMNIISNCLIEDAKC